MLSQSKPNGGEQAVGQLREFIAEGGFEPGVRLPPERELCETLGMTRNTLRRALDALEREGALWRHVGKG
ncbi:MAG: winged helix-turn-helix transcriptional regulator, partial [Rhodobacteraceae bacterium]|nr:winged helix-turn-helix transcriptional regulator [Paracoccaceae bacterium]